MSCDKHDTYYTAQGEVCRNLGCNLFRTVEEAMEKRRKRLKKRAKKNG